MTRIPSWMTSAETSVATVGAVKRPPTEYTTVDVVLAAGIFVAVGAALGAGVGALAPVAVGLKAGATGGALVGGVLFLAGVALGGLKQ